MKTNSKKRTLIIIAACAVCLILVFGVVRILNQKDSSVSEDSDVTVTAPSSAPVQTVPEANTAVPTAAPSLPNTASDTTPDTDEDDLPFIPVGDTGGDTSGAGSNTNQTIDDTDPAGNTVPTGSDPVQSDPSSQEDDDSSGSGYELPFVPAAGN